MTSEDSSNSPSDQAQLGVIVLAAGRGTRMKSRVPKVLHSVLGISMLDHVRASAAALSPDEIVIVSDPVTTGHLDSTADAQIAVQSIPLGTADAVAIGLDALQMTCGEVLVLNGDVPLIRPESLALLIEQHRSSRATITLGTFEAAASSKYGRVAYQEDRITGVVEAADDDRQALETIEANGGVYVFDAVWLREHIGNVRVSASGEYYLTSLISTLARSAGDGRPVSTVGLDEVELLGVDDRVRLAQAEKILRQRLLEEHMRAGVSIVDPDRTVIEPGARIEPDVRIEPGTFIRGKSVVRRGAIIGPYSVLDGASIGFDAVILQSWVADAVVGDRARVGPFARIRPGSSIDADVHLGNFVETKATTIGSGSRVHHFSYLGDAEIGKNVNIGAGTITCNYDGVRKHRTIIGDDVFIGSDTMLVAPVEVGTGGKTGAGAVVTRSVPPGQTVVGVPAKPIERQTKRETQGQHGR